MVTSNDHLSSGVSSESQAAGSQVVGRRAGHSARPDSGRSSNDGPTAVDRFRDGLGHDVALFPYGQGPVASDYEALVTMYLEFDPRGRSGGIPPVTEPKIRAWLDVVLAGESLLAWDDDRVVGQVVLLPYGDRGHELAIFVDVAYQHAGVGDHLVRTALALATGRGVERVVILTEGDNRGMLALARRNGFVVTGRGGGQLELAVDLRPGGSSPSVASEARE